MNLIQLIGGIAALIMILAVEEAKTNKEPSSKNDMYLEVYNKAKQMLEEIMSMECNNG